MGVAHIYASLIEYMKGKFPFFGKKQVQRLVDHYCSDESHELYRDCCLYNMHIEMGGSDQ